MTDHPQQPPLGLTEAVELANRALARVPAYPAFLTSNGLDTNLVNPTSFGSLPPMTKDNYLNTSVHSRADLVWDGDLGNVVNWSSSSGSTGKPGFWPRSTRSLYDSIRFHEQILRDSFDADKHTTLVVNTFSMGNWIAGTYTLIAVNGANELEMPVSIISPGNKIVDAVQAFALAPNYEQVVIAGYPGFVKDFVDHLPPEQLSALNVKVLLAAEAISERWRTTMLEAIGKSDDPRAVTLIYGTAEAGVMAFETPASIAIRRAADTDPTLADALFGRTHSALPTFATYDPMSRYVETDPDGFLLFTIDSTLPLMRYRIKDYGDVFDAQRLRNLLTAYGRRDLADSIEPTAHFLTVDGRPDVALTFNGLNIYTENITAALSDSRISGSLTTFYHVLATENDDLTQSFKIQVELRHGMEPDEDLRALVTKALVETLCDINGEYREQYRSDPTGSTPIVTLAEYEGASEIGVKRTPFRKLG